MSEATNPYRPPSSDVATIEEACSTESAGKWRRFGTLLIDYACFVGCAFVIGVMIALVFGEAGIASMQRIPDIVFGSVLMLAYYTFFEGIWGRTPGKFILGTIVVTDEGGKPSLWQVVKRSLCRFIPFEPFSFLGERGWHDTISNTAVVRRNKS